MSPTETSKGVELNPEAKPFTFDSQATTPVATPPAAPRGEAVHAPVTAPAPLAPAAPGGETRIAPPDESAKQPKVVEVVEPFAPPDLGSIHWGHVVSVHPFGAFVRLDDGLKDGLCHVSQLKHAVAGKRVEARDVVSEGQRIVCKVVDRSWSKMRFFLSAKWVDQESAAVNT